jgi:anti-sigma B factor antagonist
MDLDIATRDEGGICVMSVSGEVDVYTAPMFKQRLVDVIDGGCTHVVVDLSRVGFMDSSGLGTLVSGLKRIKERDGTISLARVGEQVLKVFRITGLDKVFPIFDAVDDALQGR